MHRRHILKKRKKGSEPKQTSLEQKQIPDQRSRLKVLSTEELSKQYEVMFNKKIALLRSKSGRRNEAFIEYHIQPTSSVLGRDVLKKFISSPYIDEKNGIEYKKHQAEYEAAKKEGDIDKEFQARLARARVQINYQSNTKTKKEYRKYLNNPDNWDTSQVASIKNTLGKAFTEMTKEMKRLVKDNKIQEPGLFQSFADLIIGKKYINFKDLKEHMQLRYKLNAAIQSEPHNKNPELIQFVNYMNFYYDKLMPITGKKTQNYALLLVAFLPAKEQVVKGNIYLSKDGTYLVHDLEGNVQTGNIDTDTIAKNLNKKELKSAILEATYKAGHTLTAGDLLREWDTLKPDKQNVKVDSIFREVEKNRKAIIKLQKTWGEIGELSNLSHVNLYALYERYLTAVDEYEHEKKLLTNDESKEAKEYLNACEQFLDETERTIVTAMMGRIKARHESLTPVGHDVVIHMRNELSKAMTGESVPSGQSIFNQIDVQDELTDTMQDKFKKCVKNYYNKWDERKTIMENNAAGRTTALAVTEGIVGATEKAPKPIRKAARKIQKNVTQAIGLKTRAPHETNLQFTNSARQLKADMAQIEDDPAKELEGYASKSYDIKDRQSVPNLNKFKELLDKAPEKFKGFLDRQPKNTIIDSDYLNKVLVKARNQYKQAVINVKRQLAKEIEDNISSLLNDKKNEYKEPNSELTNLIVTYEKFRNENGTNVQIAPLIDIQIPIIAKFLKEYVSSKGPFPVEDEINYELIYILSDVLKCPEYMISKQISNIVNVLNINANKDNLEAEITSTLRLVYETQATLVTHNEYFMRSRILENNIITIPESLFTLTQTDKGESDVNKNSERMKFLREKQGIFNEINELINIILGFEKLVINIPLNKPAQAHIDSYLKAKNRLRTILDNEKKEVLKPTALDYISHGKTVKMKKEWRNTIVPDLINKFTSKLVMPDVSDIEKNIFIKNKDGNIYIDFNKYDFYIKYLDMLINDKNLGKEQRENAENIKHDVINLVTTEIMQEFIANFSHAGLKYHTSYLALDHLNSDPTNIAELKKLEKVPKRDRQINPELLGTLYSKEALEHLVKNKHFETLNIIFNEGVKFLLETNIHIVDPKTPKELVTNAELRREAFRDLLININSLTDTDAINKLVLNDDTIHVLNEFVNKEEDRLKELNNDDTIYRIQDLLYIPQIKIQFGNKFEDQVRKLVTIKEATLNANKVLETIKKSGTFDITAIKSDISLSLNQPLYEATFYRHLYNSIQEEAVTFSNPNQPDNIDVQKKREFLCKILSLPLSQLDGFNIPKIDEVKKVVMTVLVKDLLNRAMSVTFSGLDTTDKDILKYMTQSNNSVDLALSSEVNLEAFKKMFLADKISDLGLTVILNILIHNEFIEWSDNELPARLYIEELFKTKEAMLKYNSSTQKLLQFDAIILKVFLVFPETKSYIGYQIQNAQPHPDIANLLSALNDNDCTQAYIVKINKHMADKEWNKDLIDTINVMVKNKMIDQNKKEDIYFTLLSSYISGTIQLDMDADTYVKHILNSSQVEINKLVGIDKGIQIRELIDKKTSEFVQDTTLADNISSFRVNEQVRKLSEEATKENPIKTVQEQLDPDLSTKITTLEASLSTLPSETQEKVREKIEHDLIAGYLATQATAIVQGLGFVQESDKELSEKMIKVINTVDSKMFAKKTRTIAEIFMYWKTPTQQQSYNFNNKDPKHVLSYLHSYKSVLLNNMANKLTNLSELKDRVEYITNLKENEININAIIDIPEGAYEVFFDQVATFKEAHATAIDNDTAIKLDKIIKISKTNPSAAAKKLVKIVDSHNNKEELFKDIMPWIDEFKNIHEKQSMLRRSDQLAEIIRKIQVYTKAKDFIKLYKYINTLANVTQTDEDQAKVLSYLRELIPSNKELFNGPKIEDCKKEILAYIENAINKAQIARKTSTIQKYLKSLASYFYVTHPNELAENEHRILCIAADNFLKLSAKYPKKKAESIKDIEVRFKSSLDANKELTKNPFQFFQQPFTQKNSITYVAAKLCIEDIMMKIMGYNNKHLSPLPSPAIYSKHLKAEDTLDDLVKEFESNATDNKIYILFQLTKIYQACQKQIGDENPGFREIKELIDTSSAVYEEYVNNIPSSAVRASPHMLPENIEYKQLLDELKSIVEAPDAYMEKTWKATI